MLVAQDLHNRVMVISAGGVDRYTGGLVNDEEVIILMNNANITAGHRGFVSMGGMGDDIAVADDCRCGRGFIVDGNLAIF